MRCANPGCAAEALYFRSGSLHWVDANDSSAESNLPRRQLIWLCAECSRMYVVETWRPAGQQVRRRDPLSSPQTAFIHISAIKVISPSVPESVEAVCL